MIVDLNKPTKLRTPNRGRHHTRQFRKLKSAPRIAILAVRAVQVAHRRELESKENEE